MKDIKESNLFRVGKKLTNVFGCVRIQQYTNCIQPIGG